MPLALIGFGTVTLAAGIGLIALGAADRWPTDILRAVRACALLLTAAIYITAIWEH